MKRQVTDQEKTFANHISDKRFASRIYTTSEKSIIRKQTIQVLKKPYQYYIQKYQDYERQRKARALVQIKGEQRDKTDQRGRTTDCCRATQIRS